MLGFALTLEDDPVAWSGLSTVLQVRLSGFERSCLLMAVVASMEAEDVEYVLEEVRTRQGIGMPLPPLFDASDEASWWAEHASPEERHAVLVAAYLSLPHRDRDAFLASASRRDAA
jgi:hypothetical protein